MSQHVAEPDQFSVELRCTNVWRPRTCRLRITVLVVNVDGCHDSSLDLPGRTINHAIVFNFAPIAFDRLGSNSTPMIGNFIAVSEGVVLPYAFGSGV